MAHDTTTRQRLRAKYVQGLNLKAASLACKVPYGTARAWKRQAEEDGDNWDLARQARRMTKGGVAEIADHRLTIGALVAANMLAARALQPMRLLPRSLLGAEAWLSSAVGSVRQTNRYKFCS